MKKIDELDGTEVFIDERSNQLVYTTHMNIDCDGSPRAYAPPPLHGLDFLANAGHPGNWWGIACDEHGNPYVQGSNDPAPGYYVSTTSLEYTQFAKSDPRRYVNAEVIPYLVLPTNYKKWGKIELGTVCIMLNKQNGKMTSGIFADTGPKTKIGEASMACAEALGINSNPKTGGTESRIVEYRVNISES